MSDRLLWLACVQCRPVVCVGVMIGVMPDEWENQLPSCVLISKSRWCPGEGGGGLVLPCPTVDDQDRDLCTVSVHNYSGATALSKGPHSHTAMANATANNMSSIIITIQVWLMCYNLSIEMFGNAV